ncbi:MAG: DUF4105 domain-containing protein [Polyangiaceae bacterium]|nr:DUF4105 domain-containing protein [Polyangiaceae bacterium]
MSPLRHPPRRALLAALCALLALALLAPRELHAAPEDPDAEGPALADSGDDLIVSVMTIGPGGRPFERFGHSAIRIQNRVTKKDWIYNFGAFRFDSAAQVPVFFRGELQYWLARRGAGVALDIYRAQGRSIDAQILGLAPEQRLELLRRLEENLRPENRYYRYDFLRDNCSTRIRDALDALTGGRLRAASGAPASQSLRDHYLRMAAADPALHVALHTLGGPGPDAPVTVCDEMFLPARLQEVLRRVTVPAPDGEAPLVRFERQIFAGARSAPRAEPPRWLPRFALAGIAAGGLLAALGALGRKRRAPRIALGASLAILGLALGLAGWLLVAIWAASAHADMHRNENILLLAPWAIALTAYGIGVARGRPAAVRAAARLTAVSAAVAVIDLAISALPIDPQRNAEIIAFLLPLWLGAAAALWLLRRGSGRL